MKKMKIIVLVFVVILLTGCTGNYNININNDLSVDENAELYVKTKNINDLNSLLSENINKKDYSLEIVSNGTTKVKYYKKYSSIEEYISSSILYNELFDLKKYLKNKKSIYFVASSLLDNNEGESTSNNPIINNVKVTITSTYDMIESNADEIDGNKYIWNISNKDISKNILFKFSLTKGSNNILRLLFIILLLISLVMLVVFYDKFKKKNYL